MPATRRNSNPPRRRSATASAAKGPARKSASSGSRKASVQKTKKRAAQASPGKRTRKATAQGTTKRSERTRASATTRSRKAAAQKSTAPTAKRTSKGTPSTKKLLPFVIVGAAAIAIIVVIALVVSSCTGAATHKPIKNQRYEEDHYWQATVEAAEDYLNVKHAYTDCVLSMIQVESSGDECVDSRHDIMQAWEGDGKKYLEKGIEELDIEPMTAQASIYAGVYELKQCIKDFKKYMGYKPDPTDLNDLALLTQGYNYGHLGWFKWLQENGLTEYTVPDSESYQSIINGLGTATHGKKIMETYERISTEKEYTS